MSKVKVEKKRLKQDIKEGRKGHIVWQSRPVRKLNVKWRHGIEENVGRKAAELRERVAREEEEHSN